MPFYGSFHDVMEDLQSFLFEQFKKEQIKSSI